MYVYPHMSLIIWSIVGGKTGFIVWSIMGKETVCLPRYVFGYVIYFGKKQFVYPDMGLWSIMIKVTVWLPLHGFG